jgi:hypothetical protein
MAERPAMARWFASNPELSGKVAVEVGERSSSLEETV